MSRFGIDPPDDDAYDVQPNADCTDCGIAYGRATNDPTTWCDACSDRRDAWAEAIEVRMATARLKDTPVVVDVAIVPVSMDTAGVVEVALIPKSEIAIIRRDDQDGLRRLATAVLAADLTTIKDVA